MADHLSRSSLCFGNGGCLAVQYGPRGALGIKAVRFAMKIAKLAIGAHHLNDGLAAG